MELSELTHDERRVLVGLARALAGRDQIGPEAGQAMAVFVSDIGGDEFDRLSAEVDESMKTEADARNAAATVTRPEARELILARLYELAEAGTITPAESQLLDWLGEAWGIQVNEGGEPYRD